MTAWPNAATRDGLHAQRPSPSHTSGGEHDSSVDGCSSRNHGPAAVATPRVGRNDQRLSMGQFGLLTAGRGGDMMPAGGGGLGRRARSPSLSLPGRKDEPQSPSDAGCVGWCGGAGGCDRAVLAAGDGPAHGHGRRPRGAARSRRRLRLLRRRRCRAGRGSIRCTRLPFAHTRLP